MTYMCPIDSDTQQTGYSYDACGNLIARPGQRLEYDALNRLVAVIDASTDTTIAAYTYDQMNRRASATDASGTVYFHYDGASPDVTAETDASGTIIATYVRDSSGRLVSMRRGGESYYFHLNARGDVIALTDDSGALFNEYRYDPYGNTLEATETVENPYRYAGYRFDEASGLYHLWNRYYDPETARFITKDLYPGETANPGTMNGYAYCLGDPVNAVDPSGLISFASAASMFGTVSLVAGAVGTVALAVAIGAASGGAATPLSIAMIAGVTSVVSGAIGEVALQEAYEYREVTPLAFAVGSSMNRLSITGGFWGGLFGAPEIAYASGLGSCIAGAMSLCAGDGGGLTDEEWEAQRLYYDTDKYVW